MGLGKLEYSGHIWYAVAQEDMTEKVSCAPSRKNVDFIDVMIGSIITLGGSGKSTFPLTQRAGWSSASGLGTLLTIPSPLLSAPLGSK